MAKIVSIPVVQYVSVPKKFVPKDMRSNVNSLLSKMLREEATNIEKNGEFHSTIISSLSLGEKFKFCTNRIPTPKQITEENIAKGTSTLKLSDFEFNVDNSTGKIFTFKSTPKEKFKELLEECNNTLKEILNNFNSENVAKNKTGLRGLIA